MIELLAHYGWLLGLAFLIPVGLVVGKARRYHKKYAFRVLIDGVVVAEFQKCSAIKAKLGVAKQREGGKPIPEKSPGVGDYEPVTLERGAADDDDLWKWWRQTLNGAAEAGANDPDYERNVTVQQLGRDRVTVRRSWDLSRAFPTEFEAGEWDNDSDDNVIEKITLEYHYFDRPVAP